MVGGLFKSALLLLVQFVSCEVGLHHLKELCSLLLALDCFLLLLLLLLDNNPVQALFVSLLLVLFMLLSTYSELLLSRNRSLLCGLSADQVLLLFHLAFLLKVLVLIQESP